MIYQNYRHYVVLFHSREGEQNIVKDLSLEIFEDTELSSQVLSKFFLSCEKLFQKSHEIVHLSYPGIDEAIKDLFSLVSDKGEREVISTLREWLTSSNPRLHIAISGFVYSGIKAALSPQKIQYCLVPGEMSYESGLRTFTKVEIAGGWVKDIDGDACPLLGCVPTGDGYVSWQLYPEATFVPILGFIDFCRQQKKLGIIEKWYSLHSELPEAKVLRAIHQIENIEIARDSLFV